MAEIIVPAIIFTGLTIIFTYFFWFRYRMRNDMQQTIRAAIERGQELSPEIIDRLGQPRTASKNRDLRWSLIWFAVSAGLAAFGLAMSAFEQEAMRVLLGLSAFPFFLGVAFAVMWKVSGRDS